MVEPQATNHNHHLIGLLLGSEGYGVRRGWISLLTGMKECGVQISTLVLHDGEIVSLLEEREIPVDRMDLQQLPSLKGGGIAKILRLIRRVATQLKVAKVVSQKIKESGATVVLLRNPAEVLLAGIAARMTGTKAYWLMPNAVSDGYPFNLNRKVYSFIFRYLHVVPIANSRFTEQTLGTGQFERHVCHLGVDPNEFDPERLGSVNRGQLGIPTDAILLGVFARMIAEKGQHRLVQALSDIGPAGRSLHLLVCGGPLRGSYVDELKELVKKKGLTERVHFVGPVQDVVSYYKICDVVVNSRLDPEPFGFSVIEGMMLAKPVLAHKAGGPGETVLDGKTGWHIHGPTVEEFSAALRRLIYDLPKLAEIGSAARQHALDNFTHRKMAQRIINIMTDSKT
ncbi:glycosyltransferase family 4 protein [Rhizobium terrae]|uniref:glycosyltransferase family 4 protein n=1 Tax=Rhizobium terrae TaxID=2171756 RepID=UPI000E3C2710|nr:glycosyltransferase family 4 protein [Rhizobium terrae]